ncbi:hypothetical protein ABLB69_11425 [Xenorhabdus khoisanae]|uniref:hypothetical protein n=1 Tax=Xenorhabdus khoisanae TaxID=880157 RepID=UPI0032B7673B
MAQGWHDDHFHQFRIYGKKIRTASYLLVSYLSLSYQEERESTKYQQLTEDQTCNS